MAIFRILACLAIFVLTSAGALAEDSVDFNRDVRPILSGKCFACHGPDAETVEGDLRLDLPENALSDRDGAGEAILPGEPDDSLLIERIESADEDEVMPPPEFRKPLSAEEKETLRRWIAQGAQYDKHWAFLKPLQSDPPAVENTDWAKSEIDHFVLAAMEKRGIRPSPRASRETLIRRVSLDMRGLPPTLEELNEYLTDQSPGAYERMVDRMLASPHYGEKLTRIWMDLARYGDTNGYHFDSTRPVWLWRDWVIKAFNDNMPFDQFTIEQLAGDLLPDPSIDQKIASGFNRNSRFNEEGGADPEEFLVRYAVDRTVTLGRIWLGMTLNCCECHSHKYDPISQKEFYQLFAFFNNLEEVGAGGPGGFHNKPVPPTMQVPSPEQKTKSDELNATIARLEELIDSKLATVDYQEPDAPAVEDTPAVEETAAKETTEEKAASTEEEKTEVADDLATTSLLAWIKQAPGNTKLPRDVRIAAKQAAEKRTAEQNERLKTYFVQYIYRDTRELFDEVNKELGVAVKERTELNKQIPLQMISVEMAEPRPTYLLIRGNFETRGEQVERDVPAILPSLPTDTPRNRLSLAKWLVDPDHPLTARVTVNRYWAQLFGRGIVETVGDFGTQGRYPTHPQLLDWLATEYVESGWDTRNLFRTILMSATYQQSSVNDGRHDKVDADNLLLWRSPRFRLPAEEIRDTSLRISGMLSPKIGGPPVHPYQPPDYYKAKTGGWTWKVSKGEDGYRRGMYTFWRRTTPYPAFVIFDAPDRSECVTSRPRTNTPLQALTTLNDPQYFEAARVFAQRVLLEGPADLEGRITWAFRAALGRKPIAAEVAVIRAAHATHSGQFQSNAEAAAKISSAGNFTRPDGLDDVELATWTAIGNILLNSDEAITRE